MMHVVALVDYKRQNIMQCSEQRIL